MRKIGSGLSGWLGLSAALALGACAGAEYRDTTAAVDANPMCVSDPDQPDAPVSRDCERKQEAVWSSPKPREPVDFTGKGDDE